MREVLAFGLAHAQARDAVHTPLDVAQLSQDLESAGYSTLQVRSAADSRQSYLARPDWGRQLHVDSLALLQQANCADSRVDLVFVIADGLSSTAVQRHALPLLSAALPLLDGLSIAPIVIATQARVALADDIGQHLRARIAVSLIGERPGLSSPDSLGIYITYAPRPGLTDEARNCISNVRPEGLPYTEAAALLAAIVRSALQASLSGVALRFDPSRALAAES